MTKSETNSLFRDSCTVDCMASLESRQFSWRVSCEDVAFESPWTYLSKWRMAFLACFSFYRSFDTEVNCVNMKSD